MPSVLPGVAEDTLRVKAIEVVRAGFSSHSSYKININTNSLSLSPHSLLFLRCVVHTEFLPQSTGTGYKAFSNS